ncbi:MAG TPA: large conductance mechanosensitive channel protein MscL [Acidimicrobiales bacterium]|nr:large conductance mechanosensitive channel protein MscL [Acidimicrobiales bacterium]
MPKVLSEFKDFISRGNVIDLAAAVVIGTAFVRIVNAIVAGLLTPLIGMIFSKDFGDMTFTVNDSVFRYGDVINAILQFLAVAVALFFLVVKPINVLNERRRRGVEAPPPSPPTDEAVLLAEIRDLLRVQSGAGVVGGGQVPSSGPIPPAGPVPPREDPGRSF